MSTLHLHKKIPDDWAGSLTWGMEISDEKFMMMALKGQPTQGDE